MHARCRRCSRFRHPSEFIAGPVAGYCLRCYEGHRAALAVLEGGIPQACTACSRSFRELTEAAGDADIRMYVHWQDGLYGVLCHACSDAYEQKRRDLYQRTPHGVRKAIA